MPEVKIKRRHIIRLPRLPVSVGHGDLESDDDDDDGGGGTERQRETDLVEISEERLDHGVLLAELCCPLLAVLGGPGGEHPASSRL